MMIDAARRLHEEFPLIKLPVLILDITDWIAARVSVTLAKSAALL